MRLFAPGTIWEWFVVEFDGDDLMFGLACGPYIEPGYFSLVELATSGVVARDATWQSRPLGEAQAAVEAARGEAQ